LIFESLSQMPKEEKLMGWEPLAKSVRQLKVAPNMSNYEEARRSFSWDEARRELDGLPEGKG
jgi:acetyl-CoA synthetase